VLWKILAIIAIFAGILGYGYWHGSTHGTIYVPFYISGNTDKENKTTPNAQLKILDSKGVVLANGMSDDHFNFFHLIHPKVGDCRESENAAKVSKEGREAWQECFEQKSTWITRWIQDVRYAEVQYGNCLFQNIPITVSGSNSDWYFWWVPHPHIGGIPYTNYFFTIDIDKQDCNENNV